MSTRVVNYSLAAVLLPTHQISFRSDKLFEDRRMDGQTPRLALSPPNNNQLHCYQHESFSGILLELVTDDWAWFYVCANTI